MTSWEDVPGQQTRHKTVVALLSSGVYGGPHNRVAHWASRLGQYGLRVVAILPDEPGDARALLERAGADVRVMDVARIRANPRLALSWAIRLVPDILKLRRVILAERADYVAPVRALEFSIGLAGVLTRRPIVWHFVDSAPPPWLCRLAGALARLFASSIPAVAPTIARIHGISEKDRRLRYIGPASDETRFVPSSASSLFLGPKRGPRVAVIGALTPMKGIEFFIQAANLVHREIPEAEFVVVGGETATHKRYADFLQREVDRLGLEGCLRFVGFQSDQPNVMADIDLLVVSSRKRSEGLPTVMINAIMAGVPVVATRVGGIPDVIQSERTGLLVPPDDHFALARGVIRLLRDPEFAQSLATTARAELTPVYGIAAWERAYREIFGLR